MLAMSPRSEVSRALLLLLSDAYLAAAQHLNPRLIVRFVSLTIRPNYLLIKFGRAKCT